jgi:hypothetical protein
VTADGRRCGLGYAGGASAGAGQAVQPARARDRGGQVSGRGGGMMMMMTIRRRRRRMMLVMGDVDCSYAKGNTTPSRRMRSRALPTSMRRIKRPSHPIRPPVLRVVAGRKLVRSGSGSTRRRPRSRRAQSGSPSHSPSRGIVERGKDTPPANAAVGGGGGRGRRFLSLGGRGCCGELMG